MKHLCSRRQLGLGSLGLGAAFALGAGEGLRRRFLFVHAEGGWDPLCVFAPMFGLPQIEMELDVEPMTIGGLSLVDSPGRPSVRTFFERWGDQALIFNGVSMRSVNHETCQTVALTGSTNDSGADWATMLAAAQERDFYLPHLVINGPSLSGAYNVVVSRAEGMVQEAVHGNILEDNDFPVTMPTYTSRVLVDDYLAQRAALVGLYGSKFAVDYESAHARSRALVDAKDLITFPPMETLRDRADNAITMLANGVTRCATISTTFLWDTHTTNAQQTPLFDGLFADLDYIMETLSQTPSGRGSLADDTVVVVVSEMARTPAYNGTQGRDHWPYTSLMVIGPGVTGGRAVGGYTELYAGIGVDPTTGEPDDSRPGIDSTSVGSTLLALGDVDPGDYITSPEVITGVLA